MNSIPSGQPVNPHDHALPAHLQIKAGKNPAPGAAALPLLQVSNLTVDFQVDRLQRFRAVDAVSFDVPERSTVALVGESGSGKSVTALSLLRLLPQKQAILHHASRIIWQGQDLVPQSERFMRRLRGAGMGMIFQDPMTSLNPVFTVGQQLTEGIRLHLGLSRRQALARAQELLQEVGIPEPQRRLGDYPHQLSGGQQQRVMIAMAISAHPRLLIADEPTTALDVTIQRQIVDLLAHLQQRHAMAVLFITHDLELVAEIAHHVVVMRHGRVCESGPASRVFQQPQDPYTRALLACRPPGSTRPWHLKTIDDFMPSAAGGEPVEMASTGAPGRALPEPSTPTGPMADHLKVQQVRHRGASPQDQTLLEVRHLEKRYMVRTGLFGQRPFLAVKSVSFSLARGKTLGIVGESGSGKTTLGLTIAGLLQADAGQILFAGEHLHAASGQRSMAMRRRIQIVFQNPFASLNPRFTVAHILAEPLLLHHLGANATEREQQSLRLLDRVGLPRSALNRYPHEFSGGQRQRIAIARCLALQPEVLICDESVSALDVSVQAQVLNLLQDLQDEFALSYLFISHDLAVVHYMADQVLIMHEGEVVEQGESDQVYAHPQHAYTQRLLQAIPHGLATPVHG